MTEENQQAQPLTIQAYDVKAKVKVTMLEAVITRTSRGAFMAKGISADGHKLTTLMNEAKAIAAVEAGIATKAW